VDPSEVLELTRLWIEDGYGKNIESYVISQCLKQIEQRDKNISVIVSYADPEQGHDGVIYQATNWLYQGTDFGLMPNYSIRIEGTDDWIHSRTVNQRYGSTNLDHLKRVIGKTFYRK